MRRNVDHGELLFLPLAKMPATVMGEDGPAAEVRNPVRLQLRRAVVEPTPAARSCSLLSLPLRCLRCRRVAIGTLGIVVDDAFANLEGRKRSPLSPAAAEPSAVKQPPPE